MTSLQGEGLPGRLPLVTTGKLHDGATVDDRDPEHLQRRRRPRRAGRHSENSVVGVHEDQGICAESAQIIPVEDAGETSELGDRHGDRRAVEELELGHALVHSDQGGEVRGVVGIAPEGSPDPLMDEPGGMTTGRALLSAHVDLLIEPGGGTFPGGGCQTVIEPGLSGLPDEADAR
jgi:hypothetical protein